MWESVEYSPSSGTPSSSESSLSTSKNVFFYFSEIVFSSEKEGNKSFGQSEVYVSESFYLNFHIRTIRYIYTVQLILDHVVFYNVWSFLQPASPPFSTHVFMIDVLLSFIV